MRVKYSNKPCKIALFFCASAMLFIGCKGNTITVTGAYMESIIINAPVEKVFNYVTDSSHSSEWQIGTSSNQQGHGLGATEEWTSEVSGIKLHTYSVIIDFVPNKKMTVRGMGDNLVITDDILFVPVGDTTRLTWVVNYSVEIPASLKPIVGAAKQKAREELIRQLERIKAGVEKL